MTPYPQVLLVTPHVVGGRSCGETQASSVWLPAVRPCSDPTSAETCVVLPSNCGAAFILHVTPAVGHALPEHIPAFPCPDASANIVAPAASSKCRNTRSLPVDGESVGVGPAASVAVPPVAVAWLKTSCAVSTPA